MKYPRSPHEKVGGVVYFGRMLDKIRLMQSGELHPDLHQNLGGGFDKRCVDFLHVSYTNSPRKFLKDWTIWLPWNGVSQLVEDQTRRRSTFGANSCEKEAGTMREPRSLSGERGKAVWQTATTFKRCSTTSTPTREDLRKGRDAGGANQSLSCASSASRSEVLLKVDRYASSDNKGIAQILGAAGIDDKLRIRVEYTTTA